MLARRTASILLSVAALSGCGDSGNDAPPDGCTGHTCGGAGASVTDREGGNIILERMTLDEELRTFFGLPAGLNTVTRVAGYFMSAQTPESNPLPTPGACNNLVTTKGWPAYVGTPHTDVDVGTLTLKGKNAAGADVSIALMKKGQGMDVFGRPHDLFYDFLQPDVSALLKPDSYYSVTFGGVAGGMPATTFENAIYLAADYLAVSEPGLEDNGPLVAGEDFSVKWTPAVSVNKPAAADLVGGDILGLTWLVDMAGSPTHVCVTVADAGEFKIPGAAITEYRSIAQARGLSPDKMILLRNATTHTVVRLPNTDATNVRRVDMLSLECWAQLMDVQ